MGSRRVHGRGKRIDRKNRQDGPRDFNEASFTEKKKSIEGPIRFRII